MLVDPLPKFSELSSTGYSYENQTLERNPIPSDDHRRRGGNSIEERATFRVDPIRAIVLRSDSPRD